MSHNVFVQGVIFDDINLLENAFNELRREGKLQSDATFHKDGGEIRWWMDRKQRVDCAINLPGQTYDVGFMKNEDGYRPFFEAGFQPQGLASEKGAEDINGVTCQTYNGAGQIGLLSQRYRLLQLERNAHRGGMATRRIIKEKGQIALEVTARR